MSGQLPQVSYLSVDPLASTVGSSQVLAYVFRLAERGVVLDLHSFEREPDAALLRRLSAAGVRWTAHPFGGPGARGGAGRVARLARAIRGAALVHARSDMAAAAVMSSIALFRSDLRWLWDVRSLWADQKVATGVFGERSPQARAFRQIERAAARRCHRSVTLTTSAIDELDRRHGSGFGTKATVITTCVDRRRFAPEPPPPRDRVRILLAGTLNRYYDVDLMLRLVEELGRRDKVDFVVAAPGETEWDGAFRRIGATRLAASAEEMPDLVASCHVGLSVCRDDAGPSLLAAMPTKIGEFLATGRPVVVNPGLVDAARLVSDAGAGVVVGPSDDLSVAADQVLEVVDDPRAAKRAAKLAYEHFDLDRGVDHLVRIYRELADLG